MWWFNILYLTIPITAILRDLSVFLLPANSHLWWFAIQGALWALILRSLLDLNLSESVRTILGKLSSRVQMYLLASRGCYQPETTSMPLKSLGSVLEPEVFGFHLPSQLYPIAPSYQHQLAGSSSISCQMLTSSAAFFRSDSSSSSSFFPPFLLGWENNWKISVIFCEKDNALRGVSSVGWFVLEVGVESLLKQLGISP